MKTNIHDAILIALAAGTILGCKKDCPPVLPVVNDYRMKIEITDNAPFGNISALFAMGNETFIQDQGTGVSTEQDFVYPQNPPVFIQREISYSDFDSSAAYLWIGTTAVFDNNYRVEVFRNDSLVFKIVGNFIDQKVQIN